MGTNNDLDTGVRPGNEDGWPRTQRQRDFCSFHVIDGLNVEQAALRAGYSASTARKRASTILRSLGPFCEHLQTHKNRAIQAKIDVTAERVAEELAAIAFGNILDYFRPILLNGQRRFVGKSPDELSEAQARAVLRWKVETIRSGDEIVYDYRYEFYDKKGALITLGKHLGMFEPRLILEARSSKSPKVDLSNVPDEVLEKWMEELQSYQ